MALDRSRSGSRGESAERGTRSAAPSPGKQTLSEIAYPHASAIQASIGTTIPGKAVLDPAACDERGVPAFTDGTVSTFASANPTLHVAAHEAAHVLQHAGTTRDSGMGAEGHAQAVADAVVAGGNARGLLGGQGSMVAPSIRNYTEVTVAEQATSHEWTLGSDARVADTGEAVTSKTDRRALYASPGLITSANAILRGKRSAVSLIAGTATLSGRAPDRSGVKNLVAVTTQVTSQNGDQNYADCGRMAREVQGAAGTDTSPRAVYADSSGHTQETAASSAPSQLRDDVLVAAGLGTTPSAARTAYLAMDATARDAFDRQHRINRYAAPGVGESFVSVRDDASTTQGFNFHWGGVIIEAGGDRVTLENFARPGTNYDTQNALWYFDMYGPASKVGQTWHERWAEGGGREGVGVGAPSHNGMSMATRTSPPPSAAPAPTPSAAPSGSSAAPTAPGPSAAPTPPTPTPTAPTPTPTAPTPTAPTPTLAAPTTTTSASASSPALMQDPPWLAALLAGNPPADDLQSWFNMSPLPTGSGTEAPLTAPHASSAPAISASTSAAPDAQPDDDLMALLMGPSEPMPQMSREQLQAWASSMLMPAPAPTGGTAQPSSDVLDFQRLLDSYLSGAAASSPSGASPLMGMDQIQVALLSTPSSSSVTPSSAVPASSSAIASSSSAGPSSSTMRAKRRLPLDAQDQDGDARGAKTATRELSLAEFTLECAQPPVRDLEYVHASTRWRVVRVDATHVSVRKAAS